MFRRSLACMIHKKQTKSDFLVAEPKGSGTTESKSQKIYSQVLTANLG